MAPIGISRIGVGIDVRRYSPKGSGVPVDPDRYMFFASRTQPPAAYPLDTTNLGGLLYFASRLRFGNAPYATRDPRMMFNGFHMAEGNGAAAPKETVFPGNDTSIDKVILRVEGVDYIASFEPTDTETATIVSGDKGVWCDFPTFVGDIPASANFDVTVLWHVGSVGEKFPSHYRIQKHRNEKFWGAASAAALQALVDADAPVTAALDTNYGISPGNQSNSQLPCVGPTFMVAKGDWDGRPVVLSTGDSLGYGRQDISATADARGNLGWEHKWLDGGTEDQRIPHFFFSCPSAHSDFELVTGAMLRWTILEDVKTLNGGKYPFTTVLNQMGTNDTNVTVSTWKSRMVGLINRIKTQLGASMPVIQCTVPPQNASTGNTFATDTAITVQASWMNTGGRGTINGDIRNNNGFNHDGFLDVDAYFVNPASTDKFMNATDMGQVGTCISLTPGDGVSVHPVAIVDFGPRPWETLTVEYQPGLYANRVVIDSVDNGNGTWTVTFYNTYTTAFQANAKVYWATSPDGVHPQPSYVDHWLVPRLPQSEKAKLAL